MTDFQDTQQGPAAQNASDYGAALIAVPCVAIALIWFWVGSMALIQQPESTLFMICAATVISTAVLAYRELKARPIAANGSSPGKWLALMLLVWPAAYPAYMRRRRTIGLPSRFAVAVAVAVVFCLSYITMQTGISSKRAEILQGLQKSQKQLEESARRLQEFGRSSSNGMERR